MAESSAHLPPLPVSIVSGYLGAGKTTLINALLAADHGLRIAVLVNDFGEIALDETLIAHRDGDVIALANGCMCCQIGGQLYDAIDRILNLRDQFDWLVIETSGVADPVKIAQIAVAEPELQHVRTVVLVDAVNFTEIYRDPRLKDTLARQVGAADSILVTKCDIAPPAQLDDVDRILSAMVLVEVAHSLDPTIDAINLIAPADTERGSTGGDAFVLQPHRLPFASWSWSGTGCPDRNDLLTFARDETMHIYRLKAVLRLRNGSSVILQKAGRDVQIEASATGLDTNRLTAIGSLPDFDPKRIEAAWNAILHQT